jgi:site-specific DNA-cytosine methylase
MNINNYDAIQLKIAVLFDGGGLARKGLEDAGHECVGFELDPVKHHLSQIVGSGNCELADVLDITPDDLRGFDAVWASPPCQSRSDAGNKNTAQSKLDRDYNDRLLQHSMMLAQSKPIHWIENVYESGGDNSWGTLYNAAQFTEIPRQIRNRVIGGQHRKPFVWREYRRSYKAWGWDICPAIVASTNKRYYDQTFRASTDMAWYGRAPTIREAAYHQGLEIPDGLIQSWLYPLAGYTWRQWRGVLYETIGNGVPVYMARAFGEAYSRPETIKQHHFFELVDEL